MKLRLIAVTALLALAACGQPAETAKQEAPAAPQGLMEQIQAQAAETQPVAAWQQLITHSETMPACGSIRRAESRGIVPAHAAGPYAGHDGELVFAIQCGPQVTTVPAHPNEHWLIFFAAGAPTSAIVNCADTHNNDQCILPTIPTEAAPSPG